MKKQISKILIANRAEIASRIIKSCHEMGIQTVAVYSNIDRDAPFVRHAGEKYLIGEAQPEASYLNQDSIIRAAKESGADAIHPGYGFLSENPSFADRVEGAGLIFIGPPARVMRSLGDKTAARRLAQSTGVPLVPGIVDDLTSDQQAIKVAKEIGFPVLLKASAGGGGKGMRVVRSEVELPSALRGARSESRSSFGDERVYMEKYLENPHHIEIQVLADQYGNVIHLGERDCSVQRRHQKVIEESPSPIVTDMLRKKMTDCAITLCKAGGYVNAGTVELLFDGKQDFYFMEMNTRLQVEHPVTEMRTGLDLVREQILIAGGDALRLKQDDVKFDGHAIEARIYAEDPTNNFFPSTGVINRLRAPSGGGLREDRGVEEGSEVTPHYDPLLSKLIAWDSNRISAINRLSNALAEYELMGVCSNIDLCRWVLNHPDFRSGNFDTTLLPGSFVPDDLTICEDFKLAAIIAAISQCGGSHSPQSGKDSGSRNWRNMIYSSFR